MILCKFLKSGLDRRLSIEDGGVDSLEKRFFLAASDSWEIGVARSGVKGQLTWGSRVLRSISTTWSYLQPASGLRRLSLYLAASAAISVLSVAARYSAILALKGNTLVVAPSSAPILQIVPIPVQEMLSTPGPKYSIIDIVPPLTVRMPASLRMTSLGLVQPLSSPVSLTPITLGHLSSHGMSAITSTASAPPTPMQRPPRPPPLGV